MNFITLDLIEEGMFMQSEESYIVGYTVKDFEYSTPTIVIDRHGSILWNVLGTKFNKKAHKP